MACSYIRSNSSLRNALERDELRLFYQAKPAETFGELLRQAAAETWDDPSG